MAQSLIQVISDAGFMVDTVSELRAFIKDQNANHQYLQLLQRAATERDIISKRWHRDGNPAAWFCYHPYYKSPDYLGPALSQEFRIPYITAEATYSERRNLGVWKPMQQQVMLSLKQAKFNLYFTDRDRDGLLHADSTLSICKLPPFIEISRFNTRQSEVDQNLLVTVAMMRKGDKLASYEHLAKALSYLKHLPWQLAVIGDGECEQQVKALFSRFPAGRVQWHGRLSTSDIARVFAKSAVYVWPGCGEAYGLAYLEAQAAGLPVVAYQTAGVPEVVKHEYTGFLTPDGDTVTYANAIEDLLCNPSLKTKLSCQAKRYVEDNHSVRQASAVLTNVLNQLGVLPE